MALFRGWTSSIVTPYPLVAATVASVTSSQVSFTSSSYMYMDSDSFVYVTALERLTALSSFEFSQIISTVLCKTFYAMEALAVLFINPKDNQTLGIYSNQTTFTHSGRLNTTSTT